MIRNSKLPLSFCLSYTLHVNWASDPLDDIQFKNDKLLLMASWQIAPSGIKWQNSAFVVLNSKVFPDYINATEFWISLKDIVGTLR